MMSEDLFEAIIISTKIEKVMKENFPKMIGVEFSYDDFKVVVETTGIMMECNNYTCYISLNPNRNEGKENRRIPINTLKHIYDFLKA